MFLRGGRAFFSTHVVRFKVARISFCLYYIIHCYHVASITVKFSCIMQVLVAMTDGISQDSVVSPSRDLRNAGVRILALGIGRKFRRSQLNQMTMNSRYVFNSGFRSLHRVVSSIKRAACKGK